MEGELNSAGEGVVATTPSPRSGAGHRISRHRVVVVAAAVVIVALPIYRLLEMAPSSLFPGRFGIFGEMMNSVETLLFPLIAVLISCLGFSRSLAARQIANTRARIGIRRHLAGRVGAAAGIAGGVFFAQALAAFIMAMYVWPILGDPGVDRDLTAADVAQSNEFAFSAVLAASVPGFGLGYALWVGAAAAAYAALAICLLATIRNRVLALAGPFLLYMANDLVFELAGVPGFALRFSSFPMGLTGYDPLGAALPTVTLVAGVAVFVGVVVRRAPTNPRLA